MCHTNRSFFWPRPNKHKWAQIMTSGGISCWKLWSTQVSIGRSVGRAAESTLTNHFARRRMLVIGYFYSTKIVEAAAASRNVCLGFLFGKWVFLCEQLCWRWWWWSAKYHRNHIQVLSWDGHDSDKRLVTYLETIQREFCVLNFICINWHNPERDINLWHAIVKLVGPRRGR